MWSGIRGLFWYQKAKNRLLRHAEGTASLQQFLAFLRPSVCVVRPSRVCLSLAAQHGGLLLLRTKLVDVWWFENSRVCLYYFFWLILCQSGSRLRVFARGCARALDGGRGFSCGLLFLIKKSRQFLGSFNGSFCNFFCGGFDSGSG